MTHIVYGIDNKYLPCLIVSMFTALKKNCGPTHVTVFTAGSEFDTTPIHVLSDHFRKSTVEIRRFDVSSLVAYEKTEPSARFPAASMLPLFLPWLVDGRCLFLDADTLICDNLEKLYKTDLNGCLIGACRSYPAALSIRKAFQKNLNTFGAYSMFTNKRKQKKIKEKASRIGFTIQELEAKFFSSGVIIFDTAKIRSADPNRNLASVESSMEHWSSLPDMDRLNQFFKDKVHYLDVKWDVPRDVMLFNKIYAPPAFWNEIVCAIRNPSVLHFSSIYRRKSWKRPWHKSRPRYRLYRRTCQEICAQVGINVESMFDERE